MKAKHYLVACIATGLVAVIYVFGTTKFPAKALEKEGQQLTIETLLSDARGKLQPPARATETTLYNQLLASRSTADSAQACESLMKFWGNDQGNHDIATWYLAQKAKLENSEKSLTFAAHFILENTIHNNANMLSSGWKAGLARELFTAALKKNPDSDSLKTGLGAAYLFGSGANTMEGVSMILQQLKNDSANAFAHKMLGFGNIRNGELNKAVSRFETSLQINPADTSLVPMLALLCREARDSVRAEKWFKRTRQVLSGNPALLQDFEAQYQSLK